MQEICKDKHFPPVLAFLYDFYGKKQSDYLRWGDVMGLRVWQVPFLMDGNYLSSKKVLQSCHILIVCCSLVTHADAQALSGDVKAHRLTP